MSFHRHDDTWFNTTTNTPSHRINELTQPMMTPMAAQASDHYAVLGEGKPFADGTVKQPLEAQVAFPHLEQDSTLQPPGLEAQRPFIELEECKSETDAEQLPKSDGARREIALDDNSLQDFWPSLRQPDELHANEDLTRHANYTLHTCPQTTMGHALEDEEFVGQVYEMKNFMSLVIKIGMTFMTQLSQTAVGNYDLNKLYSSFFPTRQEQWISAQNDAELGAVGDFDPSDASSTDFGPRTERFVHQLIAAEEEATSKEQASADRAETPALE